jgi:tRNA threonylcarbamoyladenosine biosynthesis protein TsaE
VLTGELGAGKTCFVRGLARGLGCDPKAVRSPSFTLLLSYGGRHTLRHFDAYFTTSAIDLERAGLGEALAAGDVVAVEWGERFGKELPADRLEVELRHGTAAAPEHRELTFTPRGPRGSELLELALPPGGDS